MASTLPVRVISPVMATSRLAGASVRSDTRAVTMVMPAEGPSFGMAPAGTWIWMTHVLESLGVDAEVSELLASTKERAARADSFITSPREPVRISLRLARHAGGLDEEDIASGLGPGQAGHHADPVVFGRHLVVEFARTEQFRHHFRGDGLPSGFSWVISLATLRQIEPMVRCRLRTPASRV